MEVSSHALDQERIGGVRLRSAAFTNLTRDHLDYHGTMQAYGETKARLFSWPGLNRSIVNIDDAFGACVGGPYSVAAGVSGGRAEIPAVDGVGGPCSADGWLFVDDNLGAWRCEWCAVEVEETVDESLGG